ncbi:hypothetical protein [Protaetiibacter larvae]|uniref:Uncharacterized protein n=1 Tax=Protaetiibacter larvae TaxID=2592654 RepID=A0A5C1Y7T0_9MICO|nr:hypothetical protein [Protaetiibacter larvae]QEO10014.1 hypothetical protein FLP23_08355 [Protaetiibacter larvae]
MQHHAKRISRSIRRTLKVHARTTATAVKLPDADAAIIADVLDHFAATTDAPLYVPLYQRPAITWMNCVRHLSGLYEIPEGDGTRVLEAASDALEIMPFWRVIDRSGGGARYLSFTGAELQRFATYLGQVYSSGR